MIHLSYYIFHILFFIFIQFKQVSSQTENPIQGRVFSGCELLNTNIYCYGGFYGSSSESGTKFSNRLNEHIMLNLNPFQNFTNFDKSKIQWVKKSNVIPDGSGTTIPLASAGYIKTATLSDQSILYYGGENPIDYYNPFVRYHPSSDTWSNITVPNNSNYTIQAPIVNIGDDKIWIWGGIPWPDNYGPADLTFIYDYKTNTWPVVQPVIGTVLAEHTANLVNHLIYHIGGFYTSVDMKDYEDNSFNIFRIYNTIDGTWSNLTTTGAIPQPRNFHSTVLTDDKKHLLIYGGAYPVEGKVKLSTDVYYVYDIDKNNLQSIDIPTHSQVSQTSRYGHYAAIYNSNYLLLVFGNSDLNTQAESLNVIDIHDVYHPTWLSAPNITMYDQSVQNGGVDIKTIVPAVVVPVVLVLSTAAIGLFIFIKNRKRKQKKAFVLEKENPVHIIEDQEFGDTFTEGTTVIRSNDSESQNRYSLTTNQNNNNSITIKPFEG